MTEENAKQQTTSAEVEASPVEPPAAETTAASQATTAASETKPAAEAVTPGETEAKPAAKEPETAEKPAAAKPAAEKPAADKPAAAAKPAAAKPAAAAKPPVEESPETIAKRAEAQKRLDEIKSILVDKFGDGALEETGLQKFQPTLVIKPEYWVQVVSYLAQEQNLAFNYPECFAGTDYPAKGFIEVVLYLYSMSNERFITVKVRTPRDNAEVDSLCSVFIGANWEEREIYDLLGVNFKGHPNLVRIMMDDDYKGHPLRKDFSVWDQQ